MKVKNIKEAQQFLKSDSKLMTAAGSAGTLSLLCNHLHGSGAVEAHGQVIPRLVLGGRQVRETETCRECWLEACRRLGN